MEVPRLTSLRVYPELCILRRNQKPWDDIMGYVDEDEHVDSVSEASDEEVVDSHTYGRQEVTRRNPPELVSRCVYDIEKLNSPKPKTRWQARREVEVSDLGQFALERFLQDRETHEQLTVEQIEDEMCAARPWNYGNNPDWDWFVSKIRSPSVRNQLPHAYDMGEIQRSAAQEVHRSAMLGSTFMARFEATFKETTPCVDLSKYDALGAAKIGAGDCTGSHRDKQPEVTKKRRAPNRKRSRRSKKRKGDQETHIVIIEEKGILGRLRSLISAFV